MNITILKEAGYEEAMLGLSLNKKQPVEKMPFVAPKLSQRDGGHNKFLESIQIWMDIKAPRYWWSQFDTYRVGITKQSESTMHTIMSRPLTADDFEGGIDVRSLRELNFFIQHGTIIDVKRKLPEGFLQRRIVNTNYKVIRNITQQRELHRLDDWKDFFHIMNTRLMFPEFLKRVDHVN